jgi:protein phosphatase 1 regulatory subunit 11
MANQAQPSGHRPSPAGFSSSATTTRTQTQTQTPATRPILVLRAEGAETRHIQWAEDVIDNEGLGKKSSKGRLMPKLYVSCIN